MNRNFSILLGGNFIAQVVIMLALPILGRLYTPASFGQLALLMAVTSMVGAIVHGRYHMAIPVATVEGDEPVLLVLSVLLSLVLTPLAVLVSLWFTGHVWPNVSLWVFITLCVTAAIMTALNDIFNYWRSYRRRFKTSAQTAVIRATLTASVQIVLAVFTPLGIVIGTLIGLAGSMVFVLFDLLRHDRVLLHWPGLVKLRGTLVKYRHFPLYGMTQGFIASLSWNLLPLLLLKYGDPIIAGQYWVAFRLLIAPLTLFNGSYRQATLIELGQGDLDSSRSLVKRHTLVFFGFGILPTLLLGSAGGIIFSWVMGEQWLDAGLIAALLATGVLADLFKVPAICLLQSQHRQQTILVWEAIIVVLRYSSALPLFFLGNLHSAILVFSLGGFIGWGAFALVYAVFPQQLKT
jgi:O-antigen/teichoic acid export membrane protein